MKVEIWSDIMCPFCYLGKRKFEKALEQFSEQDHVEVVYKSFQLQPDLETDPSISIHEYLSQIKGFPVEQAKQMNGQMAQSGQQVGLEYNFDDIIVANTFKAHNLLHFARQHDRQVEMKDGLFKAYFAEGENIDDTETLLALAKDVGIATDGLTEVLEEESLAEEVQGDIAEAQQIGVRGVPFFVFDRKFAISGAQESSAFLETLNKAFAEWRKNNSEIER